MLLTTEDRLGIVIDAVASSFTMSPEQEALLAAELAKPEYEGLDWLAKIEKLSKPYQVANPEPQGTAPRTEWARSELHNELTKMFRGTLPNITFTVQDLIRDQALQDFRGELAKQFHTVVFSSTISPIVISEGTLQRMMLDNMAATGLLTPGEYEALTTLPDPTYQAVITMPSPLQQLGFAAGSVPTREEIEGL